MRKRAGLAVLMMILCCGFVFAGCGGDRIIDSPDTINIKVYKGGYNSTYIYALKDKFESLYKDEGYKVNILTPQRAIKGVTILQEIYADGKVDMYFGTEVSVEQAINGEYGVCIADITDSVYRKGAIGFDGVEESTLIKDKLTAAVDYEICDAQGNMYGLPYVKGMGGVVFNKRVLEQEYGLSVPRTSKELFACYETIMQQANETGVYPYTYISGANNYPAHLTNLWLAQYAGIDWYNQFWSMTNSDGGKMTEDGYNVFDNEAITYMLRDLYEAFDYQAAAFGSMTQDLATAQAQIMRGTAVFISTGDYFFHEEALTFEEELKDISFMNTPVISALGTKLFGAGTAYGFSEALCEAVLSATVKYADANKTVAEIQTALQSELHVDIAPGEIETICNARGYTYNRADSHTAMISEKSTKKQICELFLRMCASEDGARLIAEHTYASNPFTGSVYRDSEYDFLKEADRVSNHRYMQFIHAQARGFRAALGLSAIFPKTGVYIQNVIVNEKVTIYNDMGAAAKPKTVYADAAEAMAKSIFDHAFENWDRWTAAVK